MRACARACTRVRASYPRACACASCRRCVGGVVCAVCCCWVLWWWWRWCVIPLFLFLCAGGGCTGSYLFFSLSLCRRCGRCLPLLLGGGLGARCCARCCACLFFRVVVGGVLFCVRFSIRFCLRTCVLAFRLFPPLSRLSYLLV